MILNTIIIESEQSDLQVIKSYVEKTPTLNLIGAFSNVIDASQQIKNNDVDLVFLCIKMQELNGIDFAKILPHKIRVVFTTAFKEYAVDGFKVNAIDYLLKPIQLTDFQDCVRKVFDSYNNKAGKDRIKADGFFLVRNQHKLTRITIQDILFVESLKDYVKFYMKDMSTVMSIINMKQLEAELPGKTFIRTHRSFIANMHLLETMDREGIHYKDVKTIVPISDTYKEKVQMFIDSHLL